MEDLVYRRKDGFWALCKVGDTTNYVKDDRSFIDVGGEIAKGPDFDAKYTNFNLRDC